MSSFAHVPTSDWLIGLFFLSALFTALVFVEIASRQFQWPREKVRKSVHIATGLAILPTPLIFLTWQPIFLISLLFALVNSLSLRFGRLESFNRSTQPSLGTVFYPLSFALLVVLFWGENWLIMLISFALMAFADAAAGIVGQTAPEREKFSLPWDQKTLRGSAAMFVVSTVIVLIGVLLLSRGAAFDWKHALTIAVAIGLLATAAEMLSIRGSDNLSVPLLSAVGLVIVLLPGMAEQFLYGELLALGIVILAYLLMSLDFSGAVAAFIVGSFIFGVGGWTYSIPLLVFFISSSVLSKIPKRNASAAQGIVAKHGRRDARQVLANGILPAVLVVLSLKMDRNTAFWLYLAALAAAMADTWATEIGLFFSKRPRSIITWQPVPPGTSGGISIAGTIGALAGAGLIAYAGWKSQELFGQNPSALWVYAAVVFAALSGQFLDSILGATVQRRNRCNQCEVLTERQTHCGTATSRAAGIGWIDNDVVNFACSLGGLLIMAGLLATLPITIFQ